MSVCLCVYACAILVLVDTVCAGFVLLSADGHFSLLIDKSVPVVQLVVAHKHDLIIFRTGTYVCMCTCMCVCVHVFVNT